MEIAVIGQAREPFQAVKVNDLAGNPIEIGAVVVWRVHDTAKAAFDVEDYESYVEVQTESALRHMASCHPYDTHAEEDKTQTSLRGGIRCDRSWTSENCHGSSTGAS